MHPQPRQALWATLPHTVPHSMTAFFEYVASETGPTACVGPNLKTERVDCERGAANSRNWGGSRELFKLRGFLVYRADELASASLPDATRASLQICFFSPNLGAW